MESTDTHTITDTEMQSGENTQEAEARKLAQKGYLEAVGRRKTSIARVRISEKKSGEHDFTINGKALSDYFLTRELSETVTDPFTRSDYPVSFSVSVVVRGGGIHSQAEAVRHGLARTLVAYDHALRKDLKDAGYLKRDPRMKERRKFGLKKARKAPQWSKR